MNNINKTTVVLHKITNNSISDFYVSSNPARNCVLMSLAQNLEPKWPSDLIINRHETVLLNEILCFISPHETFEGKINLQEISPLTYTNMGWVDHTFHLMATAYLLQIQHSLSQDSVIMEEPVENNNVISTFKRIHVEKTKNIILEPNNVVFLDLKIDHTGNCTYTLRY